MEPIHYYKFSNAYDETYYAYGTEKVSARYIKWLENVSKTTFVAEYAKPEEIEYCVCMEDVLYA